MRRRAATGWGEHIDQRMAPGGVAPGQQDRVVVARDVVVRQRVVQWMLGRGVSRNTCSGRFAAALH